MLDLVALGTADLQTYVWYEGIKEGDTVWLIGAGAVHLRRGVGSGSFWGRRRRRL